MALKTKPWDASEHLDSPEMIKEYIQAAIEEDDPALLRLALADVAKAKGMSAVAEQAHINRQSLYKSLSIDGNPSFETVKKVVEALGCKIVIASS